MITGGKQRERMYLLSGAAGRPSKGHRFTRGVGQL